MRKFPDDPKRDLGYQLGQVQVGEIPHGTKPLKPVGPGAMELCTQDASGWYRVAFVANLDDAVHVLHAFQKKTNQTSKADIDLAKRRLSALLNREKK